MLTAVGGFTGSSTTASMEVLNGDVWLHRPDAGWLPMPRSALACAVLPLTPRLEEHLQQGDSGELQELEERIFGLDLDQEEDSEDSDTSEGEEEMEEEEMEEDSLNEDSEEEEEEE